MSVYGIVKTRDGSLYHEKISDAMGIYDRYQPYLSGSFKSAVETAEALGYNCTVVELVPRANIRHERTHRTIIDPLL